MTYRSHADLGGQDVPGAIVQEPEGEYFHAPWEPRVMALVVAMGPTGMSNIDLNRATRETLPNYRDLSYYEIWLAALEKLARQKGVLSTTPPQPKQVLHARVGTGNHQKGLSRGAGCAAAQRVLPQEAGCARPLLALNTTRACPGTRAAEWA